MLLCLRFKDGYVIRNVALKSLSALDSTPPMDEISRFNQAAQVNKSDDYQVLLEASQG